MADTTVPGSNLSPQSFYSYQPTQGTGATNYQSPVAPAFGTGMEYINSLAGIGGQPSPTGDFNFGFNPESFQMVNSGLGALTALGQLYGMFQSLGLQKKAFKFAQEGTKRNFNAAATGFNNAVASKETARHAIASANNQDYGSLYGYGTGQKVSMWG